MFLEYFSLKANILCLEYVADINSIDHIVVLTALYSFNLILFLLSHFALHTRPKDLKIYKVITKTLLYFK